MIVGVINHVSRAVQVPHYVPISAKDEWNFDELLEKIWDYAKMIRMCVLFLRLVSFSCSLTVSFAWRCRSYTKPKGQIPDYNAPVVLHATNPSIADFCDRIHKALLRNLK